MKVTTRSYEELPPKQQAFVDAYLKCGNHADAYLQAGYKPSRRSHKANAYAMYRELQPVIQQQVEKRIGTGAILALQTVRELMQSAESEAVRLQAAKDYLARAGYDKPIETTLTIEDLRKLADEKLEDEIGVLLSKAVKQEATNKDEAT